MATAVGALIRMCSKPPHQTPLQTPLQTPVSKSQSRHIIKIKIKIKIMQTFNSATKLVADLHRRLSSRGRGGPGGGVDVDVGVGVWLGAWALYWVVKTRRYKQLALGSWQLAHKLYKLIAQFLLHCKS